MQKQIREKLFKWANDLFPIYRSLTGEGNRKTLRYIKKEISNLKIREVRSGKKVYDWVIPDEWNIKDAYITDNKGKKIVDFKKNNLHVVGYSVPIKRKITLNELKKHLFIIKKIPNAIPYVTSYYKKNWGFCIKYKDYKKLKPGRYNVFIDSNFKKNGSLSYGEVYLPGKLKKEIIFSTNICHPSMANNEISGIVTSLAISKYIKNLKKTKYSYRILFFPETIGSINFIHDNLENLKKNLKAGFVLSCVGDNGNFSYIPTIKGDTFTDKLVLEILNKDYTNYNKYTWFDRGSDERQFCSPLVDLPVVCISKSKFHNFVEYHTSLDDLNFISKKGLSESFFFFKKCIDLLEKKLLYITSQPCEPFLTKYNLRDTTSFFHKKKASLNYKLLSNIISLCNGENDINTISTKCKLSKRTTSKYLNLLLKRKIIYIQ